jgi:hypothetical protein
MIMLVLAHRYMGIYQEGVMQGETYDDQIYCCLDRNPGFVIKFC